MVHKKQPGELPKIPIHLSKGIIEFVQKADILYLQGEENITRVHHGDGQKLTAMRNIGYYEDSLCDGASFFRISKQYIINLQYLERFDASEQEVVLQGGVRLCTSRRQGRALKEMLK
jgi:DNA-binding LytR/AlgR family response regulator